MPMSTTHFFIPYLLYDIFQQYFSKRKSFFLAIIAGLAGAAPDMDFVLAIIYENIGLHRLYTHIYLVPILIFVAATLSYFIKKRNLALILTIISLGWASHVFLDNFTDPFKLNHFQYGYMDAFVLFVWICWESFKRKVELKRFLVRLKS